MPRRSQEASFLGMGEVTGSIPAGSARLPYSNKDTLKMSSWGLQLNRATPGSSRST